MLAVIAVRTPEWPEQTSRPVGAEFQDGLPHGSVDAQGHRELHRPIAVREPLWLPSHRPEPTATHIFELPGRLHPGCATPVSSDRGVMRGREEDPPLGPQRRHGFRIGRALRRP